ncbi:MAG: mannitol dehydrogenase family protein [Propylenella sp.]
MVPGGAPPSARSQRLSDATLAGLPAAIMRPANDRPSVTTGIVHLGIGAFHRAHQAVYTNDVLADDPSWGIVAASLRSPATRDALRPQDGLYTLAVRGAEGEALRVVGSVSDVLVVPEERERLLAAMASPSVRIVSLTITEKGYCHDPATGALNEAHPDIRHDVAHPHAPRTAPGLLVEALAMRRGAGVAPFTVLTCDNLPSNGHVAKRILDRFSALRDADLGTFVAGELVCPSTMVDRITPATTDEDRASIAAKLGVWDAWPVVTEPFSQWVIENRFPSGRPAWERAGAELVTDVAPYELMKLRLLNGAHSTLAYLGYLAGYELISGAMADPAFEALARGVMEEASPTLCVPTGVDLAAYKRALLERFKNPALKHRTWQICMDGSQKLPQRLLGSIRDCLRLSAPFDRLALGVAAWMRYVTGVDEAGEPIDVRDPLAAKLRAMADAAGPSAARLAQALIGIEAIFGNDLAADPRFADAVTQQLGRLYESGAKRSVAEARARSFS